MSHFASLNNLLFCVQVILVVVVYFTLVVEVFLDIFKDILCMAGAHRGQDMPSDPLKLGVGFL